MAHLGKYTGGRSEVSNCRFFGVSGMSTRRKFQDKFNEMKHYRPDVVFMNLGGNDITESTDIQNLVKRLKNIVKELYENGTIKVSSPPSLIRHALNKKLALSWVQTWST